MAKYLVTTRDIAELLSVSVDTVRLMVANREIPYTRTHGSKGHLRFDLERVRKVIDLRTKPAIVERRQAEPDTHWKQAAGEAVRKHREQLARAGNRKADDGSQ